MQDKEQWEALGSELKDIVENAITSNDFSELSDNITHIVNSSINEVRSQLSNSMKGSTTDRAAASQPHTAASYGYTPNPAGQNVTPDRDFSNIIKTPKQTALVSKPKGKAMAIFKECTGYFMGGSFCIAAVSFLGLTMIERFAKGFFFGAVCFGLVGAACILFGITGTRKRGQLKRFNQYIKAMGSNLYYNIEDFARNLGYSEKVILKDLKEMIRSGVFKEGHLDKQETCLMISDKMYDQYLETQKNYEEQERQRAAASYQTTADSTSKISTECRAVLKEGEEYIRHINYCRSQVQNPEMRDKLDRLSKVISRIFDAVKKDPDKVSDLHRMMSFYLPTTQKLLSAYCDLENQPVAGTNIETTRKEIEKSLDTLNQAFEKLLDDLFQDTAWDISSDISVLNTMLAQDGYTSDSMKINQ